MDFQILLQASISPLTKKKRRDAHHLTADELKRLSAACRRENDDLCDLLARPDKPFKD
jgi:hypothetical protein